MKTIPIPNGLWGGFIISPISAADQALEAFFDFGETAGRGGDASGSCKANTLRESTLGAFTAELSSGFLVGKRELFGMATFISNLEMLKLSKQIFNEIFSAFDDVKGYKRVYIIQPIHRAILSSNEKAEGNK
ncbi:hypothetical protein PZA11_006387 [Diplocarpon coronariae]